MTLTWRILLLTVALIAPGAGRATGFQTPSSIALFGYPAEWERYGRYELLVGVSVFAVTFLLGALILAHIRLRQAANALRLGEERYRTVVGTKAPFVESLATRPPTERAQGEGLRQDRDANIRAVLRAVPDQFFVLNIDGVYVDFHGAEEDLYLPPDQFIGKHMRDVLPQPLAELFSEAFERVRRSNDLITVEYSLPFDGGDRCFEARLVPYEKDHILGVVRDITGRRRHEAQIREHESALKASDARNRDLSLRLITSEEAERRRIARDLHDDVSQKLALLNIDLDQMGRTSLPLPDDFSLHVRELSDRVGEIASAIHRVSHQLHPWKLHSIGLVTAIQSSCDDVSSQHQIQVQFSHFGHVTTLSPEVSLCLYRVVQEALHNVVKHSGAQQASVLLASERDMLHLRIADSGVGFDLGAADGTGLGLVSMRERVSFIGGRFAIYSALGTGTRIEVRVPLHSAHTAPPKQKAESA